MFKPQTIVVQTLPAEVICPFACHEGTCQGKDKCCKKYKKGKRCKKCPNA